MHESSDSITQDVSLSNQPGKKRISKASTVCMLIILMVIYALFTDPVFRILWCETLKLCDPESVGRHAEPWMRPLSANDKSNFATIEVLVEQDSWIIARETAQGPQILSMFGTGDLARIKGEYYSVRPPVLAYLLSRVYWVEYHLLNWRFEDRRGSPNIRMPSSTFWYCYFSLVWPVAGLATAVMAVQVARCLRLMNLASRRCWIGGLCAGLGSYALPYATTLNHHAVSGGCIATALYALLRGLSYKQFRKRDAAITGLCAGFATTVDLAPGGLFLMVTGSAILLNRTLRSQWFVFAVSVLFPAALHSYLNIQITGDLVPALVRKEYFQYPFTMIPTDQLSGLPNHLGLVSIISYLTKLLWGPRGLFVYSAPLLFSVIAGMRIARNSGPGIRYFVLLIAFWSVLFMGYLAVFTNNFSGACYGVRWFVSLMPGGYWLLFAGWDYFRHREKVLVMLSLISAFPFAWTGAWYGAWQLTNVVPVLCQTLPTGNWRWSADMTLFGWIMIGCTLVLTVIAVGRILVGHKSKSVEMGHLE